MKDLSKLDGLEIIGSDEHGYTVRDPKTGKEWFEPKAPKAGRPAQDLSAKQSAKPDLKWSASDIVMLKKGN